MIGNGWIARVALAFTVVTLCAATSPLARPGPVPPSRPDADPALTEEHGRAFAINGVRHPRTGALPRNVESIFDELTASRGTNFLFVGEYAEAAYGGPTSLTFGGSGHVGNNPTAPGTFLAADLANGVNGFPATRYDISPFDLPIVANTAMPIFDAGASVAFTSTPEPTTLWLVGSGATALGGAAWRRHRRRDR
jgi:PEP-CTERM motif